MEAISVEGTQALEVEQQDLDSRHAAIARRAFEIAHGPDGGTAEENWWRAAEEIDRNGSS